MFGLRVSAIVLLCVVLAACGFHLRNASTVPVRYQTLQLELPTGDNAERLSQPLISELLPLGIVFDGEIGPKLHILTIQPTRQLLNGRLTEVQLALMVTFRIEDGQTGQPITVDRAIMARRSYQYDIATVNVDNQQEPLLRDELYREVASLIARQLSTGRLPAAQTTNTAATTLPSVQP
jgi:LPS-assembly lipoprotein